MLGSMWVQSGTGVDFSKNYSHVANNIMFQIILMVICFGFSAKMVGVETPFFMGVLRKKSTWNVPKVCLI